MVWKAVVFLALMTIPCAAQDDSCAQDTISSVSSDGRILTMVTGDAYEVLAGQEVESILWLPESDVSICAPVVPTGASAAMLYEIVNTDEHGKKVLARKLN
ncbi:MAG TPA: hypothetical protein VMF67_11370 [Rhizomicrobium sp.]|nr:hypothetical protein [Rhizomicrobium sp.]